jgi:hypothetical protein
MENTKRLIRMYLITATNMDRVADLIEEAPDKLDPEQAVKSLRQAYLYRQVAREMVRALFEDRVPLEDDLKELL